MSIETMWLFQGIIAMGALILSMQYVANLRRRSVRIRTQMQPPSPW